MAEKIFYTMGEVAEMFDVNTSLIRHWESQFPILRPKRNKKGNRLFTPQDVEHLKMIYHLVKECGMTLDGAKRALRKGGSARVVERDAELMERLQRIRSLLVEVREDLKADGGEVVEADGTPQPEVVTAADETSGENALSAREQSVAKPRRRTKPVVKIDESDTGTPDDSRGEAAVEGVEPAPGQPTRRATRKPRRKKDEPENKELFAFYEQSLF